MKTDKTKVYFNYQQPGVIKVIAKNLEDNQELAERHVKLRHGDKDDKLIGRTYAFKKLMKYLMDNRIVANEEIGKLWKEFSNNCKQPHVKLAY